MRLSVLDLIGVRTGQTAAQALRASRDLIEAADRLGYHRYWVAEHHNTPAVASTSPAIELMYLGQNTSRIRLGSGGVMLPNHSPLAVAEQFALLANVYGDRIDLGLGRAPGTDPVTSAAIRGQLTGSHYVGPDGRPVDPVEEFPRHVREIQALLSAEGAAVRLPRGQVRELRPAPDLPHPPQIWLLGSSDYSAQLAASLGMPYVFAHHFSGQGTRRALDLYRGEFQAATPAQTPTTFLSVNVSVAEDEQEAWELAEPHMVSMARLRTGAGLDPAPLVGAHARSLLTDHFRDVIAPTVDTWAVGTPAQVGDRLRRLADEFEVDEVMLHLVAGARPEDAPDVWPARRRTLELLAGVL